MVSGYADVAQLVEQRFRKARAGGSIPLIGSIKYMAKFTQVLKNKDFFLLWFGQIISQWGDRLGQMALIAFISDRARYDPWQMAKLLSFTILPVFVIGPLAGAYVDRWDRRRTMFISDFLRGIFVLAIPLYFFYFNHLLPTYIIIFLIFAISRFFVPAKLSIIPEIVPSEQLIIANSLVHTTGMIALVLGFGFSGVIVEMIKAKAGLYLDSVSFFISGILIFFIGKKIIKETDARTLKKMGKDLASVIRKSIVDEIKEGIVYILKIKQVRVISSILFILGGVTGAVLPVIIVFIQQNLSSVTKHFGLLVMFLGMGLFPGSLIYGRLGHRIKESTMLIASLILTGLFFIIFTVSLKLMPNFIVAASLFFIIGLVNAPIIIICNTIIHKVSDNNMMGKVFSSMDIFSHLGVVIFMLISSRLANHIPHEYILIVSGLVIIITGIFFLIRRKSLEWIE